MIASDIQGVHFPVLSYRLSQASDEELNPGLIVGVWLG
jgi:hypothetical protein